MNTPSRCFPLRANYNGEQSPHFADLRFIRRSLIRKNVRLIILLPEIG